MGMFKIEIVETLAKVIDVEADSIEDAIIISEEMYKNEFIELNASDYIDTKFNKFSDIHQIDEKTKFTLDIIDYLWKDEEKHFIEDFSKDHIFIKLKKLKSLLSN